MTPWARGLVAGVALGLAAGALAGHARVDAVVRQEPGGVAVDLRIDESALGRLTRPAVGSFGEVRVARRSWVVASTYEVVLRTAPGVAGSLPGVSASVSLPGRIRAPQARVAGRTATWESLPEAAQARAWTVHIPRLAAVAAAAVAVYLWGRRG